MKTLLYSGMGLLFAMMTTGASATALQQDTIPTSSGNLVITYLGHATMVLTHGGKTIHVDPWTDMGNYAALPKADLILITHDHFDHFDPKAVAIIKTPQTVIVTTPTVARQLPGAVVLKNGESTTMQGIRIEAVAAYNIIHMRSPGQPFHPKGVGNGYVLTLGDKRIYIAGDTENTPEMKALRNIDIAFLPMNLPYTMTPEMVADAARTFRPKILYPYHQGETDNSKLVALLKNEAGIEVRIRRMP